MVFLQKNSTVNVWQYPGYASSHEYSDLFTIVGKKDNQKISRDVDQSIHNKL